MTKYNYITHFHRAGNIAVLLPLETTIPVYVVALLTMHICLVYIMKVYGNKITIIKIKFEELVRSRQ